MDTSIAQVQLKKPKMKDAPPKLFTFDGVYYMKDTTEQIYDVRGGGREGRREGGKGGREGREGRREGREGS